MKNASILIVDDETEVRALINGVLTDESYIVYEAYDHQSALTVLKDQIISLVLLDLWIGSDESAGLKILHKIKSIYPDIPVVMISGHGTIDTAVLAIKNGAYDFIEKPFVIDRLLITVKRGIEKYKLIQENTKLRQKTNSDYKLIGTSATITQLKSFINKSSNNNSRIFITGPVGIGADTISWLIHNKSNRSKQPFIIINCASTAKTLEQEIFGDTTTSGLLEQASNGTVFFEEISLLNESIQRRLAKTLQNGSFESGRRKVIFDARTICYTSCLNINQIVADGKFHNELFYRLSVTFLSIPGLEERREDIPIAIEHYLSRSEDIFGLPSKKISETAIAILQSYDWPGNMIQLRNVVEYMLINATATSKNVIDETLIPQEIISSQENAIPASHSARLISLPINQAKKVFERDYLLAQINRFSGNISKTATFIGMERSALHRKLKTLKIDASIGRQNEKL